MSWLERILGRRRLYELGEEVREHIEDVIGLGAAGTVARFMRALLFGVSPLDPLSFAAVSLMLAAGAVLASYLPTSRAAAVNPMDALRAE